MSPCHRRGCNYDNYCTARSSDRTGKRPARRTARLAPPPGLHRGARSSSTCQTPCRSRPSAPPCSCGTAAAVTPRSSKRSRRSVRVARGACLPRVRSRGPHARALCARKSSGGVIVCALPCARRADGHARRPLPVLQHLPTRHKQHARVLPTRLLARADLAKNMVARFRARACSRTRQARPLTNRVRGFVEPAP